MEDLTLQITDDRLLTAVSAAIQAGDSAYSVKETTTQERKENNSIVTEADKEAEHIVREILTEESDLPILGEEHGGDVSQSSSYWVVDPIDGTHNFASEQPLYGSAVGLVEENEPTVGVFYMPELDYVFYAVSGKGAYRNETKLSVSNATDPQSGKIGISGKSRQEIFPELSGMNSWIQILGCAVAVEAWVASGWVNSAVFGALAPWDMVVGTVLIREAGGVLQEVESRQEVWESVKEGRVVMGNKELVENIQSQLSQNAIEIIQNSTYEY